MEITSKVTPDNSKIVTLLRPSDDLVDFDVKPRCVFERDLHLHHTRHMRSIRASG
jgi:hypothetical protein